jgi:hypothetical protein
MRFLLYVNLYLGNSHLYLNFCTVEQPDGKAAECRVIWGVGSSGVSGHLGSLVIWGVGSSGVSGHLGGGSSGGSGHLGSLVIRSTSGLCRALRSA